MESLLGSGKKRKNSNKYLQPPTLSNSELYASDNTDG